jgi:carboxylate-amine ligase
LSPTGFGSSPAFTVGLEEELLLVDPETLALAPVAASVVAGAGAGTSIGHEVYAASLELRSAPAERAEVAAAELSELRSRVAASGGTLMGVGVHPDAAFGDAPLVDEDRYRHVDGEMRGLIRRTPECALHVHVGMPDAETAVRVFNRMRSYLPLLQGLAANSPWWFGVDSGLASARGALVRAYPGRGIPRAFHDAADWERVVADIAAAGELPDYTFLWWDVRLHPRHGTIEVRELDAQASVDDAGALAALVRCLALEAVDSTAAPEPSETLSWSAFRALRDGVEATILADGELMPLRHAARCLVTRLLPLAREHGEEDALDGVFRILVEGGGAGRRRKAFEEDGMRGQLEQLVAETAGEDDAGASAPGPGPASVRRRSQVAP